jgi:hypothetical protein
MFRIRQDRAAADISVIRQMLTGTDPVAGELAESVPDRLALIREQIRAESAVTADGRTWWPTRHQRQRRRVVITCMAVPALLAATGGGWALAVQPAASRVTDAVVCYSLPHLPQRGVSESFGGGSDDGVAPTRMCAEQWAAGGIIPGVRRVPHRLAACALISLGMIGVFPDTTCATLHLPNVPAGYKLASRRFFALTRALNDLVGSGSKPRCVSEPAAAAYIRQAARKYGFASWRIIPPTAMQPKLCWQAQPDPASHTISIVPTPGMYAPGNGPAEVIQRVMDPLYSVTRCRPGGKPESTAAIIRELRTRLRQAGYGNWTVAVAGLPDSRSYPCYVSGGFSVNPRVVYINSIGIGG